MSNNINIFPKWMDDIPSSHVLIGTRKLGRREIDNGQYVEVFLDTESRQDISAGIFQVQFIENRTIKNEEVGIENRLGIHENIAERFGLPTNSEQLQRKNIRLRLDLDAGPNQWTECKKAKICSYNTNWEQLRSFLVSDGFLLHEGIDEAVQKKSDSSLIEFYVADMSPSTNTLQVTENTEFTQIPPEEVKKYRENREQSYRSSSHSDQSETSDRSSDEGPSSQRSQGSENIEDIINVRHPKEGEDGFEVSFDDVAGLEEVKNKARVVYGLADGDIKDKIENYGEVFVHDAGDAVLLYGPPGCGKTMISKAIASEFQRLLDDKEVAFIKVEGSDILGQYQGVSEENLSNVFAHAKDLAGDDYFTILFFDEIEALIQDRSSDQSQAHHQRLTATFLQEMNRVDRDVLVIGATNLPFDIDSAATRRFNTEIFVPHPGKEGMRELWHDTISDINMSEPVDQDDIDELAEASTDFVPSEIINRLIEEEIRSEIVLNIIDGDDVEMTPEFILTKLQDLEPQVIDRYIAQITDDFGSMDGYKELKEYIVEQKRPHGAEESENA